MIVKTDPIKTRNQNLDFYKGIAIILVVIGHTIQYRLSPSDFDSSWAFRIIYSFHMPLFIFLSGAVASQWSAIFFDDSPVRLKFKKYCDRIKKSAIRLLLPFVSWTVVKYYVWKMNAGLFMYLMEAFSRPDNSLWFLVAIFYCVTIFSTLSLILGLLNINRFMLKINQRLAFLNVGKFAIQIIVVLILWAIIAPIFPGSYGLIYAKKYLIYFILGVLIFNSGDPKFPIIVRIIPYVAFILLVPSWNRLLENNYSNLYIANVFGVFFPYVVAVMGSFVTLDLASMLKNNTPETVTNGISYLGKMSLGIYAIHTYFLQSSPIILAPIIISLIIAYAILHIPGLNLFLLGQNNLR